MLLKNTGEKIVNIGRDVLLPGEEKSFKKEVAESPAFKVMVGFGFLKATPEEADKEHETEPEMKADAVESVFEEDAEKPLRNKRSGKKSE